MNNDYAIEVKNMTARFDDNVILKDITFNIKRGEIFVIIGASGCGKSTLLRHIIGLHTPYSGSIAINGETLTDKEEDERIRILRKTGTLFQSGALFSSMTVGENVALPLEEFTDLPFEIISTIVRFKLAVVGLSGYESYYPNEISGGMQKRAGLARAMALDPDILFFDEPSSGLDPVTAVELDELILQLRDLLGTTMVIVSHDLASIYKIADRAIMLDKSVKGIAAEGSPEELRDKAEQQSVREFFQRQARDKFA